MDEIKCEFCKKIFKKKKSQISRTKHNFCSNNCSYLSKRKGKMVGCDECGIKIYKNLKSLNNSKYKKYFCSWNCSNVWLGRKNRGKLHPNWNKGLSSYKEVLSRSDKNKKCVICDIDDRRVLLAHHIDKNRDNNNILNLSWLCCNCHFLVHHYKNVEVGFLNRIKNEES